MMLNYQSTIPGGWARVSEAAFSQQVKPAWANLLIAAGRVPATLDRLGYIWVNPQSLKKGMNFAKQE
jgi:hypothetical protein